MRIGCMTVKMERSEYLIAENRTLRGHLPMRLRLADPERVTLAEIAKRLRRKALKDITQVAKPDTILAWYLRLIAQKFDGSAIWHNAAKARAPRFSPLQPRSKGSETQTA